MEAYRMKIIVFENWLSSRCRVRRRVCYGLQYRDLVCGLEWGSDSEGAYAVLRAMHFETELARRGHLFVDIDSDGSRIALS